ncbi:hypothetical protein D3C71_1875650 [compost metagenome]
MVDPRPYQAMPLTGFGGADAVGYGRDGEDRTVGTLVQTTEPALDIHALQLQADWHSADRRCRP